MEQTKEKKKLSKGKKALIIIVCIILAIALAAVIFINVITKPSLDTEPHHAVGGMVYSETVEYKSESGKCIRHNPVVRLMQMVWRFCEDGDNATHAVQTPPTDIVKDEDIFYIDDGNIYHKLDVYYPEGLTENDEVPAIIDIHGGGWIYGDKDLNEYYCLELAHKGYVVFNISYRLVPDVTVNEQLQDCAEAIKWIGENMEKYPCDGNFLLTGDSAGGQMAVYSAALLSSEELREVFDTVDGGIKPCALLLTSPVSFSKSGSAFSVYTKIMWGDYKNKPTYDYMDLDEIIDKAELPPTYLITSEGDSLAREQTLKAYDLLKEKGVECELKDFGDDENGDALPHVFSVLDPFCKPGQEAIDGALEFYKAHLWQENI